MNSAQDLYDTLPVYYCTKCLSLKVLRLEGFGDSEACYCDECGSTKIEKAPLEEWERLYEAKYKKPFLNKKHY